MVPFLMNGAEISTAAAYRIGAVPIVLNDNRLGMVSREWHSLIRRTLPTSPMRTISVRRTERSLPSRLGRILLQLAEEELISYKGGWQWDEAAIRQASVTDNVVAFVAERIRRLP